MSYRWPAPTFVACIAVGALSGTPCFATDVTNGTAMAMAMATPRTAAAQAPVNPGNGKRAVKKRALTAAHKTKRRKISSYTLFNASARHDDAARGPNTRSVKPLDDIVVVNPAPLSPKNGLHAGSGSRLRIDPASDDGVTFDCRKKTFSRIQRTLTACYMQQFDKSWKAQTYVSKGLADGSQGWGGGIAFDYAY